jgi:hypothetical protein
MRNAELYEQDFYRWTQEQIALLREGKWHEVDREHLMEEIDDLGRSARKELRSYLEGLVLHLRAQLPTLLQECYPHAQRRAARQTRLPLATFPEACPWTVEQVLDAAFWPDA